MATAQLGLVQMTSKPSGVMDPLPLSFEGLPPMTPGPRPRTDRTGLVRILNPAVVLCLLAGLAPHLDSPWVSTEEVAEVR